MFPLFLRAQTFKKIGVRDGLPSSVIYDIEPDDNGIIWIASFGSGICRYDGKTFKVLNEDNGLPSDLVRCLVLNRQKNKMYVGAQGALSIITSDSIYNKNKLYHDSITPNVLFIAVNQNTVQTSSDFGLVTLVNDTVVRSIKKFQLISGYYKSPEGNEYLSTRKGLFIITPNGDIVDFNKTYQADIAPITDLKVYHDMILLSTPKGIYTLDKANNVKLISKAEGLPEENVRCMLVDHNDVLWLGTSNGLLSTTDLVSFKKYDEKNGIDETEIKCLAVDKHNILWVGSTSNGMFKLLTSDIIKYDIPHSVTSITMDQEKNIFVLTNKAGIYKLNKDSNRFILERKLYNLPDGATKNLSIDRYNNFYVTVSNKGFLKIDPKGNETLLVKKMKQTDNVPLYSLSYKDKEFLAFKRIVTMYDPSNDRMDTLPKAIPGTFFQNMISDNNGNVWISSGSGIIKHNTLTKTNTLINSKTHKDFPPLVTNFVYPDKYNTVWVATDKGLIAVEGEQVYTNYRKDGFVSNELFGLQIIDTLLFTTCNKGLIQLTIRPSKNLRNRFILINEKFGLTQTDLTNKPLFSDSTHIWIGGTNAVFKYTPINYVNTGSQSTIFLVDIVKDSTSLVFRNHKNYLQEFVDTSKTIELSPEENDFTISYVSINHQRLKDELFIHRLVGLSNNWSIASGDNKAIYTNLNPGNYTFEVMLLGNPHSKVSVKIHIATPFYKTGWFICLLVAIGALLVYALFRIRLQSVKNQNLILETKVQQRTLQLQTKTSLLSQSNDELSKKNRLIMESIEYAKKIQDSILPSQPYLDKQFGTIKTAFFYLPKDIVSGDFFYTYKNGPVNYFAVVDCAGHGVPGALLSFSINSILHGIVENIKGFRTPSDIIRELLEKFTETYLKDKDVRESFAISLLIYHSQEKKAYISAISQSVHLSNAAGLQEIKSSSSFLTNSSLGMQDTVIAVNSGDRLFLYSDGFYDQKGEVSGKKMFKGQMVKKIEASLSLDLTSQMDHLGDYFLTYKGNLEQIDDITLFAVEID